MRNRYIAAGAGMILGLALLIVIVGRAPQKAASPKGVPQAKREPFSRPGKIRKSTASPPAVVVRRNPGNVREILEEVRRMFPSVSSEFESRGVHLVERGGVLEASSAVHSSGGISTPGLTLRCRIPSAYSDGLVLQAGSARITQQLVGGAPVEPSVEDGVVVYRSVRDRVDAIVVTDGERRIEEWLVVRSPTALEWQIDVHGAHVSVENGGVILTDSRGRMLARMNRVFAVDRSGYKNFDVSVVVEGTTVRVRIPQSDAAAYPMLVDPGWTSAAAMSARRAQHTAITLTNGKVLISGGQDDTGALAGCELFSGLSGGFESAPSMSVARKEHAVAMLEDGRVLLMGGRNTSGSLASVDAYDPRTNAMTALPPMPEPRYAARAERLPDGKILVMGGRNETGYLNSTVLYDPVSNTWTVGPPMSTPRAYFGWSRLVDGRILVAGGQNDSGAISACEIYDPSSGSWWSTGSLATPRGYLSMSPLFNGRVLAVGGWNGPAIASCEVFDPTTSTWTATGSLSVARASAAAALLPDGRVIITGGWHHSTGALRSCEVYDPSTGTWTTGASMTVPRYDHTCTVLYNGLLLIAGGFDGISRVSACELYDSRILQRSAAPALSTARSLSTLALTHSGKLVVAGGYSDLGATATCEMLDSVAGLVTAAAPMNQARYYHTANLLGDDRVLVAGGYNDWIGALATAELYDPSSNVWTTVSSMSTPRYAHAAVQLINGKVLIIGGYNETALALGSCEIFDPETGTFSPTGSLNIPRYLHAAVLLPGGKVLVVGGLDGSWNEVLTCEIYDPTTGTWSAAAPLKTGRYYHTATVLRDGRVFVAGGDSSAAGPLSSCEIYDPVSNTWSPGPSMAAGRSYHSASLLPSGAVLIAGGLDSTYMPTASIERYEPVLNRIQSYGALTEARYSFNVALLPNGKTAVLGGYGMFGNLASLEYLCEDDTPDAVRPHITSVGSFSADEDGIVYFNGVMQLSGTRFTCCTSAGYAPLSVAIAMPFSCGGATQQDAQGLAHVPEADRVSFTLADWQAPKATEIPPSHALVAVYLSGRLSNFVRVRFTPGTPPAQPSNLSATPGPAPYVTSRTPTLTASAFADPDVGATHTATQWRVMHGGGFCVWDSGTAGPTTSITVPESAPLISGESYQWQVRYRDELGLWSPWSEPTTFVVDTVPPQVTLTTGGGASSFVSAEKTVVLAGAAFGAASVRLRVNGVEYEPAVTNNVWQKQVELQPGSNVVEIVAQDAAGNAAQAQWSVVYPFFKAKDPGTYRGADGQAFGILGTARFDFKAAVNEGKDTSVTLWLKTDYRSNAGAPVVTLRVPGAPAVSRTLDDPLNESENGWTKITLTARPAEKGVATISVETFAGAEDRTYVDDIQVDQN